MHYTEQAPEIDEVNDNQHSREEVTNEPGSADGRTPSEGSAQPRISSQSNLGKSDLFIYILRLRI